MCTRFLQQHCLQLKLDEMKFQETEKASIRKTELLVVGKACKAIFRLIFRLKKGTFNTSRFIYLFSNEGLGRNEFEGTEKADIREPELLAAGEAFKAIFQPSQGLEKEPLTFQIYLFIHFLRKVWD